MISQWKELMMLLGSQKEEVSKGSSAERCYNRISLAVSPVDGSCNHGLPLPEDAYTCTCRFTCTWACEQNPEMNTRVPRKNLGFMATSSSFSSMRFYGLREYCLFCQTSSPPFYNVGIFRLNKNGEKSEFSLTIKSWFSFTEHTPYFHTVHKRKALVPPAGVQNIAPQDLSLWHMNYFDLKVI